MKPIETYRFIIWNEKNTKALENESELRGAIKEAEETVEAESEHPSWAAESAAQKFFDNGYDDESDWPMTLVGVGKNGRIVKVEVDMELIPEFSPSKAIELFPPNVDDKTLPLFPHNSENLDKIR